MHLGPRNALIVAAALLASLTGCADGTDLSSGANTAARSTTASDSNAEDRDHPEDGDHQDGDHQDGDHQDGDHQDGDPEDRDHEDGDHQDPDADHVDDDASDTAGGLDAHVHGAAELFLAWSQGDVVIDLVTPANNLFGFEHEPATEEERSLAAERTAVLRGPEIFAFNPEAGCTLVGAGESALEVDGSHAEVTASWLFACDNPDEIKQLDATDLFREFPGLLDVDAQWASPSGQSASELSASSPVLRVG